MKTGTQVYEFKSKKLKTLVQQYLDSRESMKKEGMKFARKVGANPRRIQVTRDRFTGVIFKERPSEKIWKILESYRERGQYVFVARPKMNSKDGRVLSKAMKDVTKPTTLYIQKAVGWSDFFEGMSYYGFGLFTNEDAKFCGFCAPEIKGDVYPKGLKLEGCQKVSWKTYERKIDAH